jgi:hypothetical protein
MAGVNPSQIDAEGLGLMEDGSGGVMGRGIGGQPIRQAQGRRSASETQKTEGSWTSHVNPLQPRHGEVAPRGLGSPGGVGAMRQEAKAG